MAAPMAWQAECMRDDGSFGAWLRPWRIVPYVYCGLYINRKAAVGAGVECTNHNIGSVFTWAVTFALAAMCTAAVR